MGNGDGGQEARYRAFLSYSHRDQAFGRRLHRRLERYAVPRRLVGRPTDRGPAPGRVAPVFRDVEEFSAARDLSAEVRAALAASGALVVVCSPNAAASPWVGREIELFRELHPDRPVLAALAEGEPADAFPPALCAAGAEPLAADFRPQGDGPRLALLKLVAGVLGVGLDELVQRDAQRRVRNVTAVTAGAVAVALGMSGLTAFALVARAEAQRQRAEAEALVEFMLTDLRDRLEGVGRLDVLTAVNDRTLAYYAGQDVERLPPESQARYARILHAMGEDDIAEGDRKGASAKLAAAKAVTARLHAHAPQDPERAWADGLSDSLLGYAAYRWGSPAEVAPHWRRRRAIFQRLAAHEPGVAKYRRELAFAEGDLCALALAKNDKGAPRDRTGALGHCRSALDEMQSAARLAPSDAELRRDLINRRAWLANALLANGDRGAAYAQRLEQERMLLAEMRADPRNMRLRKAWVVAQKEIANLEVGLGRPEPAKARILKARAMLDELLAFDPANQEWAMQRQRFDVALAYFARTEGAQRGARP